MRHLRGGTQSDNRLMDTPCWLLELHRLIEFQLYASGSAVFSDVAFCHHHHHGGGRWYVAVGPTPRAR